MKTFLVLLVLFACADAAEAWPIRGSRNLLRVWGRQQRGQVTWFHR